MSAGLAIWNGFCVPGVMSEEDIKSMQEVSCCSDSSLRIHPADLVPILHWLVGRRRCRYCGAAIPSAIPFLECMMITAVMVTVFFVQSIVEATAVILFGWLLVLLMVSDIRHRILPNALTATLLASGLAMALILPSTNFVAALFGAAVGGGSFFLIRLLYFRIRGIEGLGLGDVKLMSGLGAWFGLDWLPFLVLIAAGAGLTITYLAAWKAGTRISATGTVPFGAYLAGVAIPLLCLRAAESWLW